METPFEIEMIKFQNKLMDPNELKERNKKYKRDINKRKLEIDWRLKEIELLGNRLPPI